jgi:hypothetical protein
MDGLKWPACLFAEKVGKSDGNKSPVFPMGKIRRSPIAAGEWNFTQSGNFFKRRLLLHVSWNVFLRFVHTLLHLSAIVSSIMPFLEPVLRSWVTYNASFVNIYNATSSLVRLEIKNISSYFEERSSLMQFWRCSGKFKSRGIGSWSQFYHCELQRRRCKYLHHRV